MKSMASIGWLVVLVAGTAFAQEPAAGDAAASDPVAALQSLNAEVAPKKREFVQQQLALTEAEAKAFWPVYDAHQAALGKLNERRLANIEAYAEVWNAQTTDEKAIAAVAAEALDIEKDEAALMETTYGKLKRGVSPTAAQGEMDGITARLRRDFPDVYPPNGGLTFSVVPLLDQVVGDVRRTLLLLSGAVGFVLLIACANVANLLLSRALARRREMAVRTALGASRWRIARQLLAESAVLASFGGVLGVLLAVAGVRWVHLLQPKNVPRLHAISVNVEVLLFTLVLCAVCGVLFGLAPLAGIRRLDLQRHIQDTSRGSSGAGSVWSRGHNLRRLLVAAELALSVVLLIGAGLLMRSFARVQDVPPGFTADRILTAELAVTGPKYPNAPAVAQLYRDLWDRLGRLPGVVTTGLRRRREIGSHRPAGPPGTTGRSMP